MAAMCHYWQMTPRELDDCTDAEYLALVEYRNDDVRQQRREANRAARRAAGHRAGR